jgi:hypothetical protein
MLSVLPRAQSEWSLYAECLSAPSTSVQLLAAAATAPAAAAATTAVAPYDVALAVHVSARHKNLD